LEIAISYYFLFVRCRKFDAYVSKRYENNSIIITTNKDYENWNNIFEDEELTKAITDRLRHHGKVIKITGPSYRTKNQKSEVTVS